MMPILFLFLFQAHADSTVLFQCQIKNRLSTAILQLDAVGDGKLIFVGKKEKTECPLKLRFFEYGPEKIMPELTSTFLTKACKTKIPTELRDELLPQIRLSTRLKEKNLATRVQWLKSQQPEACTVDIFDQEKLRVSSEKRKHGTWGPRINLRD